MTTLDARPHIARIQRQRYGSLSIDLWPCPYDLSADGCDQVNQRVRQAIQETLNRYPAKRSITWMACSKTSLYVSRIAKELLPALERDVLAIIAQPQYQVPIDLGLTPIGLSARIH